MEERIKNLEKRIKDLEQLVQCQIMRIAILEQSTTVYGPVNQPFMPRAYPRRAGEIFMGCGPKSIDFD